MDNGQLILYNNEQMKKKLLLINCYREMAADKIEWYHEWLNAGLAAAGLEFDVLIGMDTETIPEKLECSAVLVSGSQKMVAANEVEAGLLGFLKSNRRPLLGICYGHQALAAAFGCLVKKDAKKHLGEEDIFLKKTHQIFSGFSNVFKMRESHEEIVIMDEALAANFHVLARNSAGRVEAIVHKEHPLFGVQFHPEKSGELGIKLLVNFLKMI